MVHLNQIGVPLLVLYQMQLATTSYVLMHAEMK